MSYPLHEALQKINNKRLRSYEADPQQLEEHYNIEKTILAGGYGYRQVAELVQNAVDAILEAEEACPSSPGSHHRIEVYLDGNRLYVANTGQALNAEGLDTLLRSYTSHKRGQQIGRFGIGFKSLLKFNGKIDIITRSSGSIYFDPTRCRNELQRRFKTDAVPSLRLAWPLSDEEVIADPICRSLEWAETIIRAEMQSEAVQQQIREEITSFPDELLLFLPINVTLVMRDGQQSMRIVRVERNGGECLLYRGEERSRWRVVTKKAAINDEQALADATEIHGREEVTIAWALPISGHHEETGLFWAYFPTRTPTYLPGILNAPWKLNSDRNHVIPGEWNTRLMQVAADLIVAVLQTLPTDDDPARALDFFPRQIDRPDAIAAPLINQVWHRLVQATLIPDGNKALQQPQELWRHPKDHLELADKWLNLASSESRRCLVHPLCCKGHRASRLNALAERIAASSDGAPRLRRMDAPSWFALVASTQHEPAVAALRLAQQYSDECKMWEWQQVVNHIAIIPTVTGRLVAAPQAVLSLAAIVPSREPILASIQQDPESRRILEEKFRVPKVDEHSWQSLLQEALIAAERNGQWEAFWKLLRQASANIQSSFSKEYAHRIHVRRRDGTWRPAALALLPGAIVSDDEDERNTAVLVDLHLHSEDLHLLRMVGVAEEPPLNYDDHTVHDLYLRQYCSLQGCCVKEFKKHNPDLAQARSFNLSPFSMPRSYALLTELTGAANANLTRFLMHRLTDPAFTQPITLTHRNGLRMQFVHPLSLWLLEHGSLKLGPIVLKLKPLYERRTVPFFKYFPDWETTKVQLELLKTDFQLSVTKQEWHEFWNAVIQGCTAQNKIDADREHYVNLWHAAAKDGVVPRTLHFSNGIRPINQTYVTASASMARLFGSSIPHIVVLREETVQLWLQHGARPLQEAVSIHGSDDASPTRVRLLDAFPELAPVLTVKAHDAALCRFVADLHANLEDCKVPIPCCLIDGIFCVNPDAMQQRPYIERLQWIIDELRTTQWLTSSSFEELSSCIIDQRAWEKRKQVAQGATLAERLLRAVGSRREALLQCLDTEVQTREFVQSASDLALSNLVLTMHGPETLKKLRDELNQEGLKPPTHWGGAEAQQFVNELGFPPEFALSVNSRRERDEWISGPMPLPELHDYQQEVLQGLKQLVTCDRPRRRTVVSLPTGSGKTRVTVEAAVRYVLSQQKFQRLVLWVAQSDELCEQAVQAFRQVWINCGAPYTDLHIVRLWGGNRTPPPPHGQTPVVVVASIQTLYCRIHSSDLDWIRRPAMLIFDECHHAIAHSYSEVLRGLGFEHVRSNQPDPCVFIGLSATPFRRDEEETRWLASRFHHTWLPADQERLYARLLEQGFLAQPEYEPLETGCSLTAEEIAELDRIPEPWQDLEVEHILTGINNRLAHEESRNQRLVDVIRNSREQSILFFANSVLHAHEMAARLNLAGIPSAAISGEKTPPFTRRYFLQQFQQGALRVLCNYTLLATGFDAPKVDMVVIARQVFSRVLYMQMIGRGLRGVKNGGTPTCRIVTVLDNLGRFGQRHPYHECKQWYTPHDTKFNF